MNTIVISLAPLLLYVVIAFTVVLAGAITKAQEESKTLKTNKE